MRRSRSIYAAGDRRRQPQPFPFLHGPRRRSTARSPKHGQRQPALRTGTRHRHAHVHVPRVRRATCSDATVTITLNPINDPPTTTDDFVSTDGATALTFDPASNDNDIDGDSLSLATVDAPANGTAEIVDGKLVYTPNAGFTGIDVFGYTISDGHGETAAGTVHIGIGSFPPGAPTEAIATIGGAVSTSQGDAPAISGDGRFIAFSTTNAPVPEDTNGVADVYVFDRSTRLTSRVSVASNGDQGNGSSTTPRLSADGRYVVFVSSATNLVAGDTNGVADVFRHDRVTGETIRRRHRRRPAQRAVRVAVGVRRRQRGRVLLDAFGSGRQRRQRHQRRSSATSRPAPRPGQRDRQRRRGGSGVERLWSWRRAVRRVPVDRNQPGRRHEQRSDVPRARPRGPRPGPV
jgi:hypothetical protein